MIGKHIPITAVKADVKASVRMAVNEIAGFLSLFYPEEVIASAHAAEAVAGQWLSRVKGFHGEDDFLHLTRDVLAYIQSGGERSLISDQLAYYFSGFIPSYGAACTLIGMAQDLRPWSEVQAFMHSQSYGAAKKYVETFNWGGGQSKAQAEIKAWTDILKAQIAPLDTAAAGLYAPVQYAQAAPQPNFPPTITDVPPANDPVMPRPKPQLRVLPGGAGAGAAGAAEIGWGARLLMVLGEVAVIVLLPLTLSGDTPRNQTNPKNITIPLDQPHADAVSNTTNNECSPQTEENKKNGADCENDGYAIMEQQFKYKRLVNPPKGKGLDGLFEKLPPNAQPNPMPVNITVPRNGKIIFIPKGQEPPKPTYDYTGTPPTSLYPKFVVFEAKHIAERFGENETGKITKKAKERLGCTYDGQQMGTKWTEERIPNALKRGFPKDKKGQTDKEEEITRLKYARWIFICLPGLVGTKDRLYVFIDVVNSGMGKELDSKPARTKQPQEAQKPSESGY